MQYGRRSATSSPQLRIVLSLKLHRKSLLDLRMFFLVTITSDRGQTAASRGVPGLLSFDFSPFLRRNQEPLHLGRQARAGWQPSNWLVPPPLAASQPLTPPLTCTSKTTDGKKETSNHFSFKMNSWAYFGNMYHYHTRSILIGGESLLRNGHSGSWSRNCVPSSIFK